VEGSEFKYDVYDSESYNVPNPAQQ
jgi:hypothetical protein